MRSLVAVEMPSFQSLCWYLSVTALGEAAVLSMAEIWVKAHAWSACIPDRQVPGPVGQRACLVRSGPLGDKWQILGCHSRRLMAYHSTQQASPFILNHLKLFEFINHGTGFEGYCVGFARVRRLRIVDLHVVVQCLIYHVWSYPKKNIVPNYPRSEEKISKYSWWSLLKTKILIRVTHF